jgi:hypothetical protein
MRDELNSAVRGFYENLTVPDTLPEPLPDVKTAIAALGRFLAHCRGTVLRDRYRPDIVTGRPSREAPTRCLKQLNKLGVALAIVRGKDKVEAEEYEVLRRCALDSISQQRLDVLRAVYEACEHPDDVAQLRSLEGKTRYPMPTVVRVTGDLVILGLLKRPGDRRAEYVLDPRARAMIEESGVFRPPAAVPLLRRRPAGKPGKRRVRLRAKR